MSIPPSLHFCWIGGRLPWAYVFALLSAAEKSGLAEITLHHVDPLEAGQELRALRACGGVRLSRIDPIGCLQRLGEAFGVGSAFAAIYRGLANPAARVDVLRAAILYLEGGLYADLDTITVAPLLSLLAPRQFVGSEPIVWPAFVRRSHSPLVWARSLILDVLRKALRGTPRGWERFRRIERFYHVAVCNAVMGAEARAPFLTRYLRAMLAIPADLRSRPYALGPDLLQRVVADARDDTLVIQAPHAFYPLPAEISEHWFRIVDDVRLRAALRDETRIVHWYASIHTRARVEAITPRYVCEHRNRQLYSALVCACVPRIESLA